MPGRDDRDRGSVAQHAPRGALSALLQDLARAPDAEMGVAWTGPGALHAGAVIGRFELVREIGRGGFGVVWEARDRELGRTVAFKAVRAAKNRQLREERLLREAESAARLCHPNIVTLFDVGRSEHGPYLVLELLRGEPLQSTLRRGRLSVREAVRISVQVARGLAHAHGEGVVHRDLTPGNVFVCGDGQVKVLDLGMAHAFGRRKAEGGTPGYMAPEQWRGAPEDERTDVFALGAILYRMLTGELPHPVTARDPRKLRSQSRLEVAEAPSLGALVARMLATDPVDRPRDAGEVLTSLVVVEQELERGSSRATSPVPRRRTSWRTGLLVAAAVLAGAVAVGSAVWRGKASPATTRSVLAQLTFAGGVHEYPAWSPDGKRLAYVARSGPTRKLFVRNLETGEDEQLTHGDRDDIQPAWAPDGSSIVFVRAQKPGVVLQPGDVFGEFAEGDLWRLDVRSGNETKLAGDAFNPSFSKSGKIAVDASWAGPRRIWMLDGAGHNPQQVTTDTSEAVAHVAPSWSPDGSRIAFQNIERTKFDIRVVSLDSKRISWITDDLAEDVRPVWSPTGRFVYFSSDRGGGLNVWRAPVGADGSVASSLQQVTAGAGQDVELAMSPDAKQLAFTTLRQNADIWRLPVSPESGLATGAPEPVIATTREDSRGAWSPDAESIAFNSDRDGDMNIWVFSLADGKTRRLTSGRGGDFQPSWSPDGRRIAFFSSRSGVPNIWTLEIATGRISPLTAGPSISVNPFYSPDGKWIAFQSDRSGRLEVWVMQADGTGARQLASTGVRGHFMRWTDGSDAVIFRSGDRPLTVRVPLTGGEPVPYADPKGGSHVSFSPDRSRIMDVVGHSVLWVSPVDPRSSAEKVFEFSDPNARIDYPVWSPDGRWVLFDRIYPQDGDIWVLKDFEAREDIP